MSASLLLLAGLAFADVAMPEPDSCPDGSRGTSSHSESWCAETPCGDDGSCGEGICKELALCIEEREVACGGMVEDTAEPCTFTLREVHGPCGKDGACDQGTCSTADRCSTGGGCAGCATTGEATGTVMLWLGLHALAVLGAIGLVRRREE